MPHWWLHCLPRYSSTESRGTLALPFCLPSTPELPPLRTNATPSLQTHSPLLRFNPLPVSLPLPGLLTSRVCFPKSDLPTPFFCQEPWWLPLTRRNSNSRVWCWRPSVWAQPPLYPLPAQALPALLVPQALNTVPHHYICTDSSPSACIGAFCECCLCQHTILAQGCLNISPPPAQQISSLGLCAYPASPHWLTLLGRVRELLIWVGLPHLMWPGTRHFLSRTLITLTVTCTMAVFPLRARTMSVSLTAVTPLPGIALSS